MRNPVSRQSSQAVCPWNGDKFVRLTREPSYLPRSSRAGGQPGSGSGAAAAPLGSGSGRATSASRAAASIPGTSGPALLDLIGMGEAAWDEFSRGSAIRRAHRAGFLRNVAVALGNWGAAEAVPALVRALSDPEPLVRGHAAWALGRIGRGEAVAALEARATVEEDAYVREEIDAAMDLSG